MSALTQFAETVWIVDHPLSLAGLRLGTRSTIIRLPSDGLAIISPVAFDDETVDDIEDLGDVEVIVAPNSQHHLYLEDACRRWPDARVLTPPGMVDDVDEGRAEALDADGAFGDAVVWRRIDGLPRLEEYAFVDTRSGVLVLTDLAFHFRGHSHWWTRFFLWMYGALDHFGPTRLIRFLIRDDQALGASLEELLSHSWDAIIVAHGEPIEEGGRQMFIEAFSRYLDDDVQKLLPSP